MRPFAASQIEAAVLIFSGTLTRKDNFGRIQPRLAFSSKAKFCFRISYDLVLVSVIIRIIRSGH